MIRTSTRSVSVPPTRWISPCWRTRRILVCVARAMSPISSRKMVPPSQSSNFPMRWPVAPVKDPFSCPKSSLSIRLSGMAAQLTAMKGFPARWLCFQIERATSSLPVPLSPVIMTVTSLAVTCPITLKTSCITGDEPTIPSL